MFSPRWTRRIEAEFVENWGDVIFAIRHSARTQRKTAKLPPPSDYIAAAKRRLSAFRNAVGPEWEIVGYDDPDVQARVPAGVDADDTHLVAACLIQQDALSEELKEYRVVLVSNNVRHLSAKQLKVQDIEVIKPGKFIDLLCKKQPACMNHALCKTVSDLKGYSKEQLLSSLSVHGAGFTVRHFANVWGIKAP